MKWLVLALSVAVAPLAVSAAEPKLSAKVEKVAPPDALAEPVRKLLDEQALVVRDGDTELMTVWFRTEIPAKATEEQIKNGLTYREISEGTLVGAVRFPEKFTDFRKQEIAAGVYTLRFAVQPDIGDHTGTSPHPEFCLMSQAKEDGRADAVEPKKLIEMSSLVNEGKHPAVLLMWPNNGKDAARVQVVSKGNGVYAATVQRALVADGKKAQLGFAVTVAGVRNE
ncbi:hypothetical protein GobsT_17490 [Gemmata obscuriglobus]|uniref:Uncharacterized protein n=1 Tax=Gemmata obscuriglobus TaxID=114 RepID=A0A2Z3H8L2_9BACT|nr:hypothetical protein [Gemmata obscuriglobus]AWM39877.1 hypothetical protein C1280_24605 [Gemmata obscuriglobus]QEG26997.1 hypothetical protein GobsT_17490 [Gemmata obscuriglobus]VTS03281.1 Uncharacterized protein OS=Singulisphaera acidiphila (strain ATCC BAA-1392 / DSM 18658 / VKM B-2454 / MOB10) GN=Sinac_3193 PE=4 SV=1 [Gemmata obscuriglobus UQM 2246]